MSHVLTASQAATWRLHPQRVRGYLTVWEPELICQFVCDMAVDVVYPCSQIAVNSVLEGDVDDIEVGMLFRVYDATGATLKGTGRAKGYAAGILTIHPVGQGDIDLTDGDVVEVYDFYLPYALLPYIAPDGTLYKDYSVAFDDQTGDAFPPVANATVDRHADWVDSSGEITVTFDASTSFAMIDSGSISSYAWDFKDGTVITGSTSTPQAVVQFPAGRRWVSLVVTDNSSNASSPKRVPIFAGNTDTHKPHRARLGRLGYSLQAGWEASFDLLDTDTSGIPDHALVIFWLDRLYGGQHQNLTGCSTQFIGWTTSELIGLEPLWWSTHTLNAQGPIAILSARPAFPQTVRRETTPATWAEVKGLDWWKTAIYLLMWHSNILDLCNLARPVWYDDYPVPRLDTEAGTLVDQLVFLAHAVFAEFTGDHLGSLHLPRNPHLMLTAERATATPIVALTAADLVADASRGGPQFEYSDWDTLAWLKASAIVADTSTSLPVQSIAPGTMPGQGAQIEMANRLLVLSQAELNERIGYVYANKQGRRNGRRVMRRGTLTLKHMGCVIDPAWLEPVTLTLTAARNKRGYAFDGSRLVPTGMEIVFDHERGVIEERLTVEEETSGAAAVTVIPAPNTLPVSPDNYYPEVIDAGLSGMSAYYLFRGTKVIAAPNADGYLYITSDFDTPSAADGPTFARYNLGVSGTPVQFVPDAFSPFYLGSGSQVNGWLITTHRIYYITDVFGVRTVTSKYTFRAATTFDSDNANRSADASFGVQNHLVVCTYYGSSGTWAAYTTDNINFYEVLITNQYHTSSSVDHIIAPGCYVSPKTPGLVYTTAMKTSGSPPVCAGYVSTTYGATWAETNGVNGPVMNPGESLAGDIHVPYNLPDELTAYYGWTDFGSPSKFKLYKNAVNVSPPGNTYGYGPFSSSRGIIATAVDNASKVVAALLSGGGATDGFATSLNGAVTWVQSEQVPIGRIAIAGDDTNVIYRYGRSGAFTYSEDFGLTWDDRSGNISEFSSPAAGLFVGICGGG